MERRPEQRLNLLLEEYRSLRSEVTSRIASRMTLLGFLTASLAFVVGIHHRSAWVWALVGLLVAFGAGIWVWSGLLIGRLSARLAKLEEVMNALAAEAYGPSKTDEQLVWETDRRRSRNPVLQRLMS